MYRSLGRLSTMIAQVDWPGDFFSPDDLPSFLDRIYVLDCQFDHLPASFFCRFQFAFEGELAVHLPGLDGMELVAAGDFEGFTFLTGELVIGPESHLTLNNVRLALRFDPTILKPAALHEGDPVPPYVEIKVEGSIRIDDSFSVSFAGFDALQLTPAQIGSSGVIIAADDVKLDFSRTTSLPEVVSAGFDDTFIGVFIGEATVKLPEGFPALTPADLVLKNCVIGSGGVGGRLEANYYDEINRPPTSLFGLDFRLKKVTIEFKQNALTEVEILGEMLLPFFDQWVEIDAGFDTDGVFYARLVAAADADGLKQLTTDAFTMQLDSIAFEVKNGLFTTKLSGKLTPIAGGITWPSFDVRELSIDTKGKINLEGGWIPLPKSYSIDFHGAKLEITKFGMGKTDDGGKYIGMSGKVELVKGLPGGGSVEGLRITWYKSGSPRVKVTFNGIGISFKTPALSFDGYVSYTQDGADHQYKGDLKVVIPAANNLTLVGKAVFGRQKDTKYFAIYLEGEFGTGLPLGATGLALYGLAGLVAVNYAPDKPGTMLWYSVDHSQSFFHKPKTGVTDIIGKWKPEAGTFAIGAGITLRTYTDGGYAFSGKFLLLLLCPGPVLMIDGSAAVMRSISDKSDPPFHGLIVLDNRAGYFMIGLDARWKKDPQRGDVADISGSMEVYFNFHDPRLWHLWLGKKDPIAQRIQARFAKAFTANAYFMLNASQLQVGVWIGTAKHYNWGPVGADLEAWMAADALVNFKPSHFHADIEFYGHFAIKIFRFHLALTMDATLAADIAKPFHIKGALDITIETRLKDFHVHLGLEWGPRLDPPDMHETELLPVQSWGVLHSRSSNEWPLQPLQVADNNLASAQAAVPVVPVDSWPYFNFAFPMFDVHGVGVNSSVPTPEWTMIGDPSKPDAGSAQAKFSLTEIALYRVDGNTETLVAAHPKPAGLLDIHGSWAPSVPGTSGGQNKLMLWSPNPLDFADKTGRWNPWLSSNLPGYPCPDTALQTICMDFEDLDLGQQLYGTGWHTQNLDFQLAWSDAGPHPIVKVSPVVEKLDRGLLFPAPKPRKRYHAYVSSFGGNKVSVVDLVTRKVIATIPAGKHPRQVVLSPNGHRAYVCNQADNTVIVIDTASNQRLGPPIRVITAPDSIAISRDGKRAFVPSEVEPAMSVIDLQSLQVTKVTLRAVTNQAVLSPDGKKLYLIHGPEGTISVFDADSLTRVKTLKAAGGPAAMVIHPSEPRAWVSFPSLGTVRLFDTSRDELTALETPTGKGARDLALSMDGARLYVGNLQEKTVSVLDTNALEVVATIAIPSPAGLRMTPDGAELLVANYLSKTIAIIDPSQNKVVAQGIATGQGSNSFAVMEAPSKMLYRALVANVDANAVSVVDLQARQVLTSIPVGSYPRWIALAPDGRRAYVCNSGDNTVTVIDPVTNTTVDAPIPVVAGPDSIAITPDGKRAFVMSGLQPTMSVIDLENSPVTAAVALPGGTSVILSANGLKGYAMSGTVKVFSPASLKVTKDVPTPGSSQFMALHPSLPRAFVSFEEGWVQEFDTNTEEFIGKAVTTGSRPRHLCFSPDGARLYVCNYQGNTISVIDSATKKVTATIANIPGPWSAAFTGDGSMLAVASRTGSAVVMIDAVTNLVLGNPIPCPPSPFWLVLQGVAQPGPPLPLVPIEVSIDVPRGSSSVEVTWVGKSVLRGTVSKPFAKNTEVVATPGSKLILDVAVLDPTAAGLALSGIDQIHLSSDSAWTLLRVCVTRLPFAGGLAAQQTLRSAFQRQVDVLTNPTFLLDPQQEYKVRLNWSASVKGLKELANWSESFSGVTELKFKTAMPPPLLPEPSDPNVPPRDPSTVKGLDDLSLYVRRTIPVTQTPNDQIPELTKPVFCGYDVTVEFNESYVDQLYQMAGRDLDLLLFDRNNEAVRDALGQLIIVEGAWENAPKVVLTETQALWIDMFNANTCALKAIDPKLIPTSKVLGAKAGHVLAGDSVYEARLVPQLMRQTKIVAASWTLESFATGTQIFNPGTLPEWTDYRVSVLVTLETSDAIGILFGYTDSSYYEFTMDPGNKRRRLKQVIGITTTPLREECYVYNPGQDEPYRIRIEAVGSRILISQNGAVVFTVTDATLLTGTVGLRPSATQDVFKDFGVSDLSAGAPIAYRFHFTTSMFANFYHQIHSFQDQLWAEDWVTPLNLLNVVSPLPSGELPAITDEEARAYDEIALEVLGSASAQDPPQVEVTRLEHENTTLGWFVRSPEPIEHTRVEIRLSAASRILARGQAPSAVKITEAELGDPESVTLLAQEAVDLTGYRVEYRQMPSALADALGSQILWQGNGSGIAGDQTWSDYRASVVCHSNVAGGIGIQFRYLDAQNFYTFTYDFTTGLQTIVRTGNGVSTDLKSASSDPAPGIPGAPPVLLAISVLGSQITCYREGQKVLEVSDSTFPLGGAGAFSGGNSSVQFDSFEVHRLPNESYALWQGDFSTSTISGWVAATDSSGLALKVVDVLARTNVILRVRLKQNSLGTIGFLLRYQDLNNHYRLLFTDTERRLECVAGGVVTILWNSALTASMNRSNEIVVSLLDTTISVFQNSILACEVVDASFSSGNIGLCKGPGADFIVSQLVLYPPEFAFSNWTAQDEFQELSTDTWTLVDEGDQGGPSEWQVTNGRLTQASAIADSSSDPIRQRGTVALNRGPNPAESRLVTRLLTPQAGAIGVVFGYQDADNFYRFSMNATANPSEQYRRLVRCVNGTMAVLWSDSVAFEKGREYVLTLDLIDDYVTGWLDGEELFQCKLPGAVIGSFGLYCCGNIGASFGNFRVGIAAWNLYYTFGHELPLSAGNRVKIAPAVAVAPNRRTSVRLAAELDDAAFSRLPPAGVHLRIVAPNQTVQHGREFIPTEEYSKILFQALRNADGTGIFLAPLVGMAPGQTVEMSFLYHRDNGVVAFTEVGESVDEVVSIDLPTDSENTIVLSG